MAENRPDLSTNLSELITQLKFELIQAVHDRVQLFTLELRQVGLRVTQMVLLATLAALFVCSAWTVLLIGIYMACVNHGMYWAVAIAVILVLNLVGAAAVWWMAHSLSSALTFPATRWMIRSLLRQPPKSK